MDPNSLETLSGARFSYLAFPNCQENLDKFQVPLTVMLTPTRKIEDLPLIVSQPLKCAFCSAFLNPNCQISFTNFTWGCCFCGKANKFPEDYRAKLSPQSLPPELQKNRFVIEYEIPEKTKSKSDDFVLLIDLCQSDVNLSSLKRHLIDCINSVPVSKTENRFALVCFARNLFFYIEDPKSQMSRCIMAPHDATRENLARFLGVIYDKDRVLNVSQNYSNYFFSSREALVRSINDIEVEAWTTPQDKRPMRATGKALESVMSFLEFTGVINGSRIVLFTSGPCTIGQGTIADLEISQFIRKTDDIEGGKPKETFDAAQTFYNSLANKAIALRTTIDIFGFSLDQFGLTEMNALVFKTGGIIVMNEEFKQEHFKQSVQRYFRRTEEEGLQLGSGAILDINLSKELRVQGCIGSCASLENKSSMQSTIEVGECRTNSWYLGGTDTQSTLLFFLGLAEQSAAKGFTNGSNCYIQFVLTYRPNGCGLRKRVFNFERQITSTPATSQIIKHIDQFVVVVSYAKLTAYKFFEHDDMVVIRFLDKVLINLLKLYRTTSNGIPPELNQIPQYLYYLRKSSASKKLTTSLDEKTFYRYSMIRENMDNCLVIIQPQILEFSLNAEEPTPVLPDIDCMKKDVILLADTFFHVITWQGSTIKTWIDAGYHKNPEYDHLAKMLEKPEAESKAFVEERVLCPSKVGAYFGSPTERLLKSRLNPENKTLVGTNDAIDAGNFISEDATLSSFVAKILQILAQN